MGIHNPTMGFNCPRNTGAVSKKEHRLWLQTFNYGLYVRPPCIGEYFEGKWLRQPASLRSSAVAEHFARSLHWCSWLPTAAMSPFHLSPSPSDILVLPLPPKHVTEQRRTAHFHSSVEFLQRCPDEGDGTALYAGSRCGAAGNSTQRKITEQTYHS